MAGFNLPITIYTPQQLAEIARAAFKPPALNFGGGGGLGGGLDSGRVAPAPAINAQDVSNLGQSLGGLGKSFMGGGGGGAPGAGAMLGEDRATAPAWPPPRADGGPVMPGQSYMVGERGPETFVPAAPGYIVPNDPRSAVRPAEMPSDPFSAVRRSEMPGMADAEIARLLRGMMSDPNSAVRPSEMPSVDPNSVLRGSERDFFGGRRRRR